jgi:hypothetical protein
VTERRSETASAERRDVGTVAGTPITRARLEQAVARMRRGPGARHMPPETTAESMTLRRWLVQGLVAWDVMAHEARAMGLHDGDDAVGRVPRPVVERLFERVTVGVTIPDAAVRDYYRRNADRYRRPEVRHVLHALCPDEGTARRMASRLREDRQAVPHGTAMWALRRGEFTGPLEEGVFGASIGDVVGPVRSEHGWHACRLEAIVPAAMTPFEHEEQAIRRELTIAARSRAFEEWLERRSRELVVLEPAYEHPGHPVHGLPRHRH